MLATSLSEGPVGVPSSVPLLEICSSRREGQCPLVDAHRPKGDAVARVFLPLMSAGSQSAHARSEGEDMLLFTRLGVDAGHRPGNLHAEESHVASQAYY